MDDGVSRLLAPASLVEFAARASSFPEVRVGLVLLKEKLRHLCKLSLDQRSPISHFFGQVLDYDHFGSIEFTLAPVLGIDPGKRSGLNRQTRPFDHIELESEVRDVVLEFFFPVFGIVGSRLGFDEMPCFRIFLRAN